LRAGVINGGAPHVHRNGLDTGDCRCPWCRQTVSRDELIEIQVRQDELAAEIEAEVKSRLITERDAEIEKVRQKTATAIEAAERAMRKREAAIRREAAAAANAALAPKLAEATQAKKDAAAQIKALRAGLETTIATRLEAQRETFEKATAGAVLAERAKYLGEKLKMEEQLQDMQRRLQAKSAYQLGEPAEVDLFEALETAFPHDRISRVVKGVRGPDVIVEVIHKGAVVGSVALDSKNHARWSNKFTQKLRSDQLAEGADFAILSSSVFPAGAQQLHVQDSVIVADPARVVVLVHLLRKQILDNFMQKLGSEARASKADAMYDYILSPNCDALFDKLLALTRDLSALDTNEIKVHRATWTKRAELVLAVNSVREEFVGVVAEIIGGGR
jgi:hypothetical protein